MAEFRAREEHAREEGAERHRQAGSRHQLGDADDEEEGEGGEELAQVRARDEAKRRCGEVAPDDDHARDRGRGDPEAHPQRIRIRTLDMADEGDERDQRNRGEVLEQQDAERRPARRRVELLAVAHRLGGDRSGREREREAADERGLPVHAPGEERGHEDHAARGELDRAAAEEGAAHAGEPARLELEADHEEHQHDAELGEVLRGGNVADEVQPPRADQSAGREVAEDRADAEARGERHADHRGREENERFAHQPLLAACPPFHASRRERSLRPCSRSSASGNAWPPWTMWGSIQCMPQ